MVTPDVAVCTLSEAHLPGRLVGHPRIAVARPLFTANLGIEALVLGTLASPAVRHLVVCGRDSRLFGAGQSLVSLLCHGMAPDGRIVAAEGYRPVLPSVRSVAVQEFRRQIRLHDLRGCRDPEQVLQLIDDLPVEDVPEADASGEQVPVEAVDGPARHAPRPSALPVHPRRRARAADEGFLVVDVDRRGGRIILRQYRDDLSSGCELAHHAASALLGSAVDRGLVTDPYHAGYLGAELAKAEAALRLGLDYLQDRPLRCHDTKG